MVAIYNRLNQRIIINLNGRRNLDLLAKSAANISEEELNSPHLQCLINKGDVVVAQTGKTGNAPKIQEPKNNQIQMNQPKTGVTAAAKKDAVKPEAVGIASEPPKAENVDPGQSITTSPQTESQPQQNKRVSKSKNQLKEV